MPEGDLLAKKNVITVNDLSPVLASGSYIAWNRYQAFTPIAERFLQQLKLAFSREK